MEKIKIGDLISNDPYIIFASLDIIGSRTDKDYIFSFLPTEFNNNSKHNIIRLFFSEIITVKEYDDIIELIKNATDSIKGGVILDNKDPGYPTPENKNKEYYFREKIKLFNFQIDPPELNISFKFGMQSNYFTVKLDHFIPEGGLSDSYFKYSKNFKYGKYHPEVYINSSKPLFINFLNFMKETRQLTNFILKIEEELLKLI